MVEDLLCKRYSLEKFLLGVLYFLLDVYSYNIGIHQSTFSSNHNEQLVYMGIVA